jgi:hypothetical protein
MTSPFISSLSNSVLLNVAPKVVSGDVQKIRAGAGVRLLSNGTVEVATDSDVGGYLLFCYQGNVDEDGNYLNPSNKSVRVLMPTMVTIKAIRPSSANSLGIGSLAVTYQDGYDVKIKAPTENATGVIVGVTVGAETLVDFAVFAVPFPTSLSGGGGGGGSTAVYPVVENFTVAYPNNTVTLSSDLDTTKAYMIFVNGLLQNTSEYTLTAVNVVTLDNIFWNEDNQSYSLTVNVFYYAL